MNGQIRHETHAEALRRLLQVARESGVRILQDDQGNYWCTSASEPNLIHRVSPERCSCRGFTYHGRCRHQAALLEHLGGLDPEPPTTAKACPHCHGTGVVEERHSRWVGGARTGYRDVWTAVAPCPVCAPLLAA